MNDLGSHASDPRSVLREMRRQRRRNRIAEMEWFEILYRVYLTGISATLAVLFLAGLVDDTSFTSSEIDAIGRHGPTMLGLLAGVAILLGMRSGTNGGPLSVEEADVRHVLLAPLPSSAALSGPALQRLRAELTMGAGLGAVVGLLVSHRSIEPAPQWVVAGAIFGGVVGSLRTTTALIVHAGRVPRLVSGAIAWGLLGWQGAAVLGLASDNADGSGPSVFAGPFDTIGALALWPIRTGTSSIATELGGDVVVVAITVVCAAVGIALAGRLSLEALARRSGLVSQLRFAVTLQDLRTVVLLRRQLSREHTRVRPWFTVPARRLDAVTARSLRSLAHFPARRVLRMVAGTSVAAVLLVGSHRGHTPLVVAAGLVLYLVALDLIEPLSQEVDQPWRTDLLPVERGWLHLNLLRGPALGGVFLGLIGVVVAVAVRPRWSTVGVGAMVSVAAFVAAIAAATIAAVRGAPDPINESAKTLYMPPEVTGLTTLVRSLWPPMVSVFGCLPMGFVVVAERAGSDPLPAAARATLGVCLGAALVFGWVRVRDDIRRRWSALQKEAQR